MEKIRFIKNFKELGKANIEEAGGKGASLGEMLGAGIAVPPGFVVLASAFDRFLEETDLNAEVEAVLKKVNFKDVNSVDRASNEIRSLIDSVKMPEDLQKDIILEFQKLFHFRKTPSSALPPSLKLRRTSRAPSRARGEGKFGLVAVRSSATAEDSKTASWAGELESYLNTGKKDLPANVKKCWSSLFTPRAIFYRHEKKLSKTKVSVAVVVQQMVQSEVSGISFTVHPVTEDKNQMIIEAGWGLGEAIVSGSITPDSYVVHKREMSILDINIAEQKIMITRSGGKNKTVAVKKNLQSKQKLSGKQIIELAKLCLRVEKHWGFAVDIEWAFAKGKFYIVQSRPITTLK